MMHGQKNVKVKDGEDQLDRSCEKWSNTKGQGWEEYRTNSKIGHIFYRNCLLKAGTKGR